MFIKKIISIGIISTMLFSNILINTTNATNIEQNKINDLLKEQTKEQIEIELQLFKLQKNIVSGIEKNINTIDDYYNSMESKINELNKGEYSYTLNNSANLSINTNKNTSNVMPFLQNNQELLNLQYKGRVIFFNGTVSDKLQVSQGGELKILNNRVSGNISYDEIREKIGLKRIQYNIKDFNTSADLNYHELMQMMFISEEQFKEQKELFEDMLNKINININSHKEKPFLVRKTSDLFKNTPILQNVKNNYVRNQKEEVFRLLKQERLFKVYKNRGNEYYIMLNNDLAKKINKIIGEEIITQVSYQEIMAQEKKKSNMVEKTNNGQLRMVNIEKDRRTNEIKEISYILFNENHINTILFVDYEKSNTIFFDKNKLQIRNKDEFVGQIIIEDNSMKGKIMIKNDDIGVMELKMFFDNNMKNGVINMGMKDLSSNTKYGNINLFYVSKNDEYRLKFEIDIVNNNKMQSDVLKDFIYQGNLIFGGELAYKNNAILSKLEIKETSILPIDIKGDIVVISQYSKVKNNIENISNDLEIKEYQDLNDFFNQIIK